MKRRCVSMLMAAMMLCTACGSTEGSATGDEFEARLELDVEAQITVVGNYKNFEALEQEFAYFNEIYPNVELTYQYLDDYFNVIMPALESSEAPDLFMVKDWQVDEAETAENSLTKFGEYLMDPELEMFTSEIAPSQFDETGKYMPLFASTHGMLVNKDLFESVGVEVPTNFEELSQVCEAFKAAGYETSIYGFCDSDYLGGIIVNQCLGDMYLDNNDTVEILNSNAPEAKDYILPYLESMQQINEAGYIDYDKCVAEIEDNYNAVILRFFEGDVPMMICDTDVVSGTKKRETQSEAYAANPFKYVFVPLPFTNDGAVYKSNRNLGIAVNKNSEELAVANEFVRFLTYPEHLNRMAYAKGLPSATNDWSYDDRYAEFSKVSEERSLPILEDWYSDSVCNEMKGMLNDTLLGHQTAREAIEIFGTTD